AGAAVAMLLSGFALSARAQVSHQDLVRVRSRAERAQSEFEAYRRRVLPVTAGYSATTSCDLRIGRFCYWHDDAADPPPEPQRVAGARRALLETLDSLSGRAAADPWIVGQRVRYLVEAKRAAEAVQAAEACAAAAWWCAALTGFAEHALGNYHDADGAFGIALAAMPAERRCRWTDMTDLLPADFAKEYSAFPCRLRDSVNARLWWLADPRWALPGNDFRSEVHARLTMAELVRQARSAHDMAWGDDMGELLLRYGWPTAWSRTAPSAADPTRVGVVGHEAAPSFEFVPKAAALRDPLSADRASWAPAAARPITRYAPPYARRYTELLPQVAWFARGDSAAVVVAYDVAGDTVFGRRGLEAAVVIARGPHDAAIARTAGAHDGGDAGDAGEAGDAGDAAAVAGALIVHTTRERALLSIEVVDSAKQAFGRARFAVQPPSDTALSDVLLFDGRSGTPDSFDSAVARALGTPTVNRAAPFGLYWELYGHFAAADSVTYDVTFERTGSGLLRRLAERVGLAQRPEPVSVGFDERPEGGGPVSGRSLLVDVSHVQAGRYRLTLTVRAGREAVRRTREVAVK
ncbi:MAG: hypothetical protein ACT4R6_04365, partial [Gemmatimonadaceae bacterium]